MQSLYIESIRFAAMHHAIASYGDRPYYTHFEDVEQVLVDHGEDDIESLICANLHDILEGTDLSYSDIKNKFGVDVAEVVYLCTDNKGRSRATRKNEQYYTELKTNKKAIKIKVADRIANTRVSKNHSMGKKYKEEYNHFKAQLKIDGHIESMWNELDNLMENVVDNTSQNEPMLIPSHKVKYNHKKRLPVYFYSFKYKEWFKRTPITTSEDSLGGVFYYCKLISMSTGKTLEELAAKNGADLKRRIIDYVNSSNIF